MPAPEMPQAGVPFAPVAADDRPYGDQSSMWRTLERARLAELWCYPVKSCGGHRLESAAIEEQGLRHDRRLMVVEAGSGRFLTQRQHPRMALIVPERQDESLLLRAPGMPALAVDLRLDGPRLEATVWKDQVSAVDQGDAVARWLGDYLGVACRLVRMAPAVVRTVDPQYAPDTTATVGFADGYPFLLLSQESLADLNERLALPLPINRFRANLVLAGSGLPFGEDLLRRFSLGSIVFEAVKPCARCSITTVDQASAEAGKEPLRTLASFRKVGDKVLFGQNAVHEQTGVLRIGDRLRVHSLQDFPIR